MDVVNPYRRIYSSWKENQVLNGKITKKKETGPHKDQNNNKKQKTKSFHFLKNKQ